MTSPALESLLDAYQQRGRRIDELEAQNAALKATVSRLREALVEVERNVSSNENRPTSVLANIGRIARAALSCETIRPLEKQSDLSKKPENIDATVKHVEGVDT